MAPAIDLPQIDFEQIKKLDLLQTYWLLFEHMKNDFVHRVDFAKALNANALAGAAPPPDFVLKGTVLFPLASDSSGAEAVAQVYKGLAEAGGAVREGLITGLETLTS